MNRVLTLFATFVLAHLASAGPLEEWKWLHPRPAGFTWKGITYGAGQFVAVGEGASIMRSTNGTNWGVVRDGLPGSNLTAVAWANGTFVAVGLQGLIISSPDGTNWTSRQPFSVDLYSVAFGAGRFVAVGGKFPTNWVQTSVDGIAWTAVTNVPTPTFDSYAPLTDVTWGDRFIAVAARSMIIASEDGLIWQAVTNIFSAHEVAGVTYGNGIYVAVGPYTILRSTNGTSWRVITAFIGHYHADVAYGAGKFVIAGNTGVAGYSADGLSWTGFNFYNGALNDIVYADGRFVAVGDDGFVTTSADGTNWPARTGPRFSYNTACSPEGCVVLDSYNAVYATSNFLDWTAIQTNQSWNVLRYLNGRFIGGGRFGVIHVATNLYDWTAISSPTSNDLAAVAFGNGRYVMCGESGTIVTSSNALDWQVVQVPFSNHLGYVAFGNGRFITRSYLGDVAVSTNGIDWTVPGPPIAARDFARLTFGNGVFLMIHSTGSVMRTTDGVTWSSAHVRTNASFSDVTFAHGMFFIGGSNPYYGARMLFASRDATNWTEYPVPYVGNSIIAVTEFGDGLIVTGGPRLLQSGAFPRLNIARGAPLRLSLSGAAGSYGIESSSMINGPWQIVTNLAAGGEWTIPSIEEPMRFYRARFP